MVTIGMNYEVIAGKGAAFEKKFARVVEAMSEMPDHVQTRLYRDVSDEGSYLVVSEWGSRKGFEAFVASDAFRRVTAWGSSGILRSRPRHQVYGDEKDLTARHCPAGAQV